MVVGPNHETMKKWPCALTYHARGGEHGRRVTGRNACEFKHEKINIGL